MEIKPGLFIAVCPATLHRRKIAKTKVAMVADNNARFVVDAFQNVDASSRLYNTPPIGAPNAAARPAATPAETKSERSKSL